MNDLSQKTILILLLVVTAVAFLIAGTEDYDQRMIESIPDEAYQEIVEDLGAGCSERDIMAEYTGNRGYYDSIKHLSKYE